MEKLGKGIEFEVKDGVLYLKIKLNQNFGPSKTGKTIIVATSSGNKKIEGTDVTLGLNLYK
jgi:hypothetical protein